MGSRRFQPCSNGDQTRREDGRGQKPQLFTYKWLLGSEMTVSTSWRCRFASLANSTVVLQFYLPENSLLHLFKMHVPRPYFQRHWGTRYSAVPMMNTFKAPHVILIKVAPDRETTEPPLGPRFQFWQLPPRDSEDVLVSEQNCSKTCTGMEYLYNNVQSAQRSILGVLQSLSWLISPFLTNLKLEYRVRDADIKESIS